MDLAGTDAVVDRARDKLAAAEPVVAIHLVEAVLHREPAHSSALDVMVDAHQALLDSGAEGNFWESGWLHHQLEHWRLHPRA